MTARVESVSMWPSQQPTHASTYSGAAESKPVMIHHVDFKKVQTDVTARADVGRQAERDKWISAFMSIVTGIAAAAIAAYGYRLGLQNLTRNQQVVCGLGTGVMGFISVRGFVECGHYHARAERAFKNLFRDTPPSFEVKDGSLVAFKA
jgi:hypothetical protein